MTQRLINNRKYPEVKITLTGDLSGTGSPIINTTINAGVVGISNLSATGTPSSTTYLRGDNTWATIQSGGVTTLGAIGSSPNANGATITGSTLNLEPANASFGGALSSTDWSTFNSKESALTFSTGLTRAVNTITNNLSTGVSGGQSVIGGTASGNNLTLSSTSNATKGKILFGNSAFDEVNNRLGINTTTPLHGLDVKSNTQYNRILGSSGTGLLIGSYTSSEGAIWDATVTPSYTNYMFLCSGGYSLFNATAGIQFRISNSVKMTLLSNGNFGIGLSPTAVLTLKAGTATANTAPLKLTTGTNLTTAEVGAIEFTTDNLYFTITTGAARKNVTLDEGLTSGRVPFATTNGRLIDDADMTFATDTLTVTKLVGATSVKVGTAAGYISSDGSTGATGTFTTADLKTVTVKDGIITSIV